MTRVAGFSGVVIKMVPDSADVRLVLRRKGVFEALRAYRSVIVDMSTIAPAPVARDTSPQAAARRGGAWTPRSAHGEIGAVNASLSVRLVGGVRRGALERVGPS
jgi:3-hydroxyisobutyrate dehydrogenase-like beta-hydroxyacid dehydrogenase